MRATPLSIVVVTWQSARDLEGLITSMNDRLEAGHELIVVDNNSDDEPEAAAARWQGPGTFLRLGENAGYGAAMNLGVARAHNEAIVTLNADTELRDGGLPDLAERSLVLDAITGPRVVNLDGSPQPSASGPPSGPWPWVRAVLPGALSPSALLAKTEPWRLTKETRVSWLTGACLAGPASRLRALGPFDPAIHLYGEDLDLGLRAATAGVASYFEPALCTVAHTGKGSSSQRFADLGRAEAGRNGRAVIARHLGASRERGAYRAARAGLRLRIAAKGALGKERTWERMTLDGLRSARDFEPLGPHRLDAPLPQPVEERSL